MNTSKPQPILPNAFHQARLKPTLVTNEWYYVYKRGDSPRLRYGGESPGTLSFTADSLLPAITTHRTRTLIGEHWLTTVQTFINTALGDDGHAAETYPGRMLAISTDCDIGNQSLAITMGACDSRGQSTILCPIPASVKNSPRIFSGEFLGIVPFMVAEEATSRLALLAQFKSEPEAVRASDYISGFPVQIAGDPAHPRVG